MGSMYTAIQFAIHCFKAKRWDAFHSPYLFSLFTQCCDDSEIGDLFTLIESRRAGWIKSRDIIRREDFGAGTAYRPNAGEMRISSIAKRSLSLPFQCRFMSRLATYSNPMQIVELGTSLGISTAYLAVGAPGARIDTVEGDPEIAAKAKEFFALLHLNEVVCHIDTFEGFTSRYTTSMGKIDLLFLDGDHRLEATLSNYQSLKPYYQASTIVIVDDIYWSKGMNSCWQQLITLPEVTQSVDCFHFGLLFFNKDFLSKENHRVRLPYKIVMR